MWSFIIKSIVFFTFLKRVVGPVLIILALFIAVFVLPFLSVIKQGFDERRGVCVETSFKTCPPKQTSK